MSVTRAALREIEQRLTTLEPQPHVTPDLKPKKKLKMRDNRSD
jgi:hypothetical protein